MLNCCIERKRLSKIRTASLQFTTNVVKNSDSRTKHSTSSAENLRKSNSNTQRQSIDSQSSISDDDEFFEALEIQEETAVDRGNNLENFKNIHETDSDLDRDNKCAESDTHTFKREGGKEPFGDLKLLVSGEPLIVPVTQVGCKRYQFSHNY